jgi:hypothetical protein
MKQLTDIFVLRNLRKMSQKYSIRYLFVIQKKTASGALNSNISDGASRPEKLVWSGV